MTYLRDDVVKKAQSWIGKNENDGSYKEIIDIYNKHVNETPRKVKMLYTWPWCAVFYSSVVFDLEYTPIMPVEMSCAELVKLAQKAKIWNEDDSYVPNIGDIVLYDWNDDGKGDCVGPPDHVGIVEYVNKKSGYFTVIEGNYSNAVKKRTVSINGIFIRGFIVPNYTKSKTTIDYREEGKSVDTIAHEVISGVWGNGEERKKLLSDYGYDYQTIQNRVNEILNGNAVTSETKKSNSSVPTETKVTASTKAQKFAKSVAGTYTTTANLYLRNDSGTNKVALCQIPKGTKVECYGYYNLLNSVKWLYIQVPINGILYTGFSCSTYLKKV